MGFERLGNSQRHVVMVVIRDSMYGPVAVRSEIGHRVTGRAELFTVLHRHFQGLTNYGVQDIVGCHPGAQCIITKATDDVADWFPLPCEWCTR